MRIRSGGVGVVLLALMAAACTESDTVAEPLNSTSPSTSPSLETTSTSATTSSTTESTMLPQCVAGPGQAGIDARYEDLRRFYNTKETDAMVRLIGDGPVFDPSLEPESDGEYSDVGEWLEAAADADDFISVDGYGFYEPFALYAARRNPGLESVGIEALSVTLRFWVSQDCEKRVEVSPMRAGSMKSFGSLLCLRNVRVLSTLALAISVFGRAKRFLSLEGEAGHMTRLR